VISGSDVVLFTTAWRRPDYLAQALDTWTGARGVSGLSRLVVALGRSDPATEDKQRAIITAAASAMGLPCVILPDSDRAAAQHGMHRAIGEALTWIQGELAPAAVICTEEDIAVSDDVLEYMLWELNRWEHDPQVLTVCAHDEGGQGWHVPGIGARGGNNPQDAVRLSDDFNPWCWATWGSRLPWLLERWDWDATLGGPMPTQHGYDWQIRFLVHATGMRSVVPAASRSQNLGRDGGVYAKPELYEQTLAASYRPHRPPTEYKVVT
jgi:hypothetical protein